MCICVRISFGLLVDALTLLVGRQEGHPACKNRVVGCWCGCLSGARCRLAYGPADATALIVSCFSKIQIGFTFLVPAHPGSSWERAVKRVCVVDASFGTLSSSLNTSGNRKPFLAFSWGSAFFRYSDTHTHTRLTALCPGLSGWAGTRKVKPVWILLEQEIVSGSGISWTTCKSALRSRQIAMPAPHHSVFTGRMPFLPPNQQRQSTEGIRYSDNNNNNDRLTAFDPGQPG